MLVKMERKAKLVILLLLLALLLQVISPITVLNELGGKDTTLHSQHHSLVAPMLLKEKEEENESQGESISIILVALIDFTEHTTLLSQYHGIRLTPFDFTNLLGFHPHLFTLYGRLLI